MAAPVETSAQPGHRAQGSVGAPPNTMTENNFINLALQRSTVVRSLKVALVVGTALGAINHYDMFLSGDFEIRRVAQLLVTYLVPYGVATYGAVMEAMSAGERGSR